MVKITISNKIAVTNLPSKLLVKIKEKLSLPNPEYVTMLKLGRPAFWVRRFIEYFIEKNNTLYIGRGCEEWIKNVLDKNGIKYEIEDNSTLVGLKKTWNEIPLREYQRPVMLKFLQAPQTVGVLKLGTGFGKSIFAIEIARHNRQKTLIIVPREHLLQQYVKDIRKFCKFEPGIIQGNKRSTGPIVIATIQTLDRMVKTKEIEAYRDEFGMVIADECHSYITKKRLRVIQSFNPKLLYGMSATPERTDEQDKAITFTFGGVIVEAELPQRPPEVECHYSNVKIPPRAYHETVEDQVNNGERNLLIANLAMGEIRAGRKILILTKRIDHAKLILEYMPDSLSNPPDKTPEIIPIYAENKDKAQLFEGLRNGNIPFKCLIGTFSLLGTGSDIPSLDTLIFAGDLKSAVLQKQSVGRILRIFEGKQSPKIIDIADNLNPYFWKQFKARHAFYKKHEWGVIIKN